MDNIKKILVICTGNSCRSPMAEGFLREYLKPADEFEIISAGISTPGGIGPTSETVSVMQEEGIDISSYISTPFQDELAQAADLILVMADMHKSYILERVPAAGDKTFLFKEFADIKEGSSNVVDPICQPLSVYKSVKEDIKKASLEIMRKIKE
ncbi:low molecular weight protein arginine phosphatase [Candidatus Omnitrophota bacterium]